MVFGRSAKHCRSANINFFNKQIMVIGLRQCIFKRVEVYHQKVNALDALCRHGSNVIIKVAPRQQTTMNFGVKRFDAPAHDFRKSGYIGNIGNAEASIAKQAGRSAG